ncbi:Bug family tripartite tricarboxylate transporter substrate binding protein [Aquabacterium sp.]|uniref:Bug family tripartite tricarboxylate transporter substrate binding protein n=1 Tax=Aquabacterium sp. TaxID=1872578 RepID=UPI002BDFDA49|nr:tripartite tricarboxylate transporter substrate-binding protein [Aquabacterium sp.]HSW04349.1 tripartite tricarboxylate transporter substrate-binding protein [Aquabacterium sp.]
MKILTLVAAFAAALLIAQPAAAQAYPSKPVRIIVPYQPGQGTDVATRYLAEHLAKAMGQTFVVENKAGAGGNIGTAEAARAAADGYTLLMGTNGTHVLNQFLYPTMPFEPEKDFEPVMLVSSFPMVLLANPSSPFNSLADLLAAAKAKPDAVDVALPSTTALLVLELLKQQTGTTMLGIRYKGSASSMTEVIGGQVPVTIDTVSASRPFIASGKLKALGVTSLEATDLLPGVKPVSAQGVAGFQVVAWNGLYAPRGTPAAVVRKLNAELAKILAQPEVKQRLLELGHEPASGSPAKLAEFARSERQKWGPLIQKAGIKAD